MGLFKNIGDAFKATSEAAQYVYQTSVDGTRHAFHGMVDPVAERANQFDAMVEHQTNIAAQAVYNHAIAPTVNATLKHVIDPVADVLVPGDGRLATTITGFATAFPMAVGMSTSWTGNGQVAMAATQLALITGAAAALSFRKMKTTMDRMDAAHSPVLDNDNGPQ